MKEPKVDPNRWYSLTDLLDEKIFPWCSENIPSYRRMVLADKDGDNHLKTVIIGKGRTARYRIKGANIIQFIAQFENGKVRLR